jgi:hypothetical protein
VEEGAYPGNVAITDTDGPGTSITFYPYCQDAPLSMSWAAPAGSEGGAANGVIATFTDTGGPEPAGNYSATINWGDGQESVGTVTSIGNNLY